MVTGKLEINGEVYDIKFQERWISDTSFVIDVKDRDILRNKSKE